MNYAITIITSLTMLIGAVVLLLASITLIKRQKKLLNSIILVEFKSVKAHFIVGLVVTIVLILATILAVSGVFNIEEQLLYSQYGIYGWQFNLIFITLLFLLLTVLMLLIVLTLAKSAIVDKGIYTVLKFLDWYHVHDYIIDENKGLVLLSASKNTFNTLRGTTPPLRVSKQDIPKLKFILDKNKNKFSKENNWQN